MHQIRRFLYSFASYWGNFSVLSSFSIAYLKVPAGQELRKITVIADSVF